MEVPHESDTGRPVFGSDNEELLCFSNGRTPSTLTCCGDCRNSDDGADSSGSISTQDRIKTRKRQIQSIDEVAIGDHVTWHRTYPVWHHAIVVKVKPGDRKLTVVHYTSSLAKHKGQRLSVREEEIEVDPTRERFFVHDYKYDCRVSPSEVVAKARSRLGENRYNPFSRNCEHFAYWCKTGFEYSSQVKYFLLRLWKTCGSATSTWIREEIVNRALSVNCDLPVERVLGMGLKQAMMDLSGGSLRATKQVRGAEVLDLVLNFGFEAALFANCFECALKKWKAGEITPEEYHRRVIQAFCECAGGFLGGIGGSYLGKRYIPVPILGSAVGCVLGSSIGRLVGYIAGRKICDWFMDDIERFVKEITSILQNDRY